MHTCACVTDRIWLAGRAVRIAGQPTQAGRRLDNICERRIVTPRPVESEAGHSQHHCVRTGCLNGSKVHPDLVEYPGCEVLHDDIASRDEPPQQLAPAWGLQVK